MKRSFITFIAVTFILAAGAPVFAQNEPGYGSQEAPPPSYSPTDPQNAYPQSSNGAADDAQADVATDADVAQQPSMARISFLSGDVSIQRGDSSDWVAATLNTPVAQGDRISTGPNARAEVQLDYANVLRLSGNSVVTIPSLARNTITVQVGQGLVSYTVLANAEATAEVDTPNVAVRPAQGEGEFRIAVNSDSDSRITVRRGSADIATPDGSTRVDAGQMISIAGTDNPQYQTSQAYGLDDWDRWVSDRDRRLTRADSWRHTNRYYTGSEDLDAYGQWQNVPDYGQVWSPSVASGWAPYSDGSWVWEPYYGWTWVSYEPWGWAPYHYGRWFVYGGNWVWWPGPVAVYPTYYPVWAPAYVSFFGFGGGFGVSVGFGGFGRFGWLPSGPGDWFCPWWGRWGGRFESVGFRDFGRVGFRGGFRPLVGGIRGFRGREFSNIREVSTNVRIRNSVTTIEANRFGREGARFGARGGFGHGVSESELRAARFINGRNPVTPTHASYSASNRAASESTIRRGSANSQRFFSASRSNSIVGRQARLSTADRGFNRSPSRLQTGTNLNRPAGNSAPAYRWNGRVLRSPGGQQQAQQPSNRPQNGSQNRGTQSGQGSQSTRPGWHSFNEPSGKSSTGNRSGQAPSSRPGSAASGHGNDSRGFTPPSTGGRGAQPPAPGRSFGQPGPPNSNGGSQRGFAPPPSASRPTQPAAPNRGFAPPSNGNGSRGFGWPGGSSRGNSGSYNRPQLNMHQPVVTPRGGGYPSNRGGSSSGGRGYSAPSGGSHGGGAPRGGGSSSGSHSSGGSHGGSNARHR